jgi:hypothetical protein
MSETTKENLDLETLKHNALAQLTEIFPDASTGTLTMLSTTLNRMTTPEEIEEFVIGQKKEREIYERPFSKTISSMVALRIEDTLARKPRITGLGLRLLVANALKEYSGIEDPEAKAREAHLSIDKMH